MKKIALAAMLLISLSGCKNALDRKYHSDTLQQDLEVIISRDNMTLTELNMFRNYLNNAEANGEKLEGMTYREILEAAKREW